MKLDGLKNPVLRTYKALGTHQEIMIVLGYILFGLGFLAALVGEVRFLVVVYRYGLAWFFACLFIPFVGLLFFLLHIKETWRPVLLSTGGLVVASTGYIIGGFNFLS